MRFRHMLVALVAISAAVAGSASAGAPAKHSLMIRHQLRGCHTWSVDGGAFKAQQSIVLARGGSIVLTNNDVMPHRLVKTSGPSIQLFAVKTRMPGMGMRGTFAPGMLAHMGATVKVAFRRSGVYRFTTKAGEDYVPGMKTIGEDNVLQLIVTVS